MKLASCLFVLLLSAAGVEGWSPQPDRGRRAFVASNGLDASSTLIAPSIPFVEFGEKMKNGDEAFAEFMVPTVTPSNHTLAKDASDFGASEGSFGFFELFSGTKTPKAHSRSFSFLEGSSSDSDVATPINSLDEDASDVGASEGPSSFWEMFRGNKIPKALSPSFSYLGSLGGSQGSSSISDVTTSKNTLDEAASFVGASEVSSSSDSGVATSTNTLDTDASIVGASEDSSSFATTAFGSQSRALFRGFKTPRALSPSTSYLGNLGASQGWSDFSDVATSNTILDTDASTVGASEVSSSSVADVATSTDTLATDFSDLKVFKGTSSTFSDVENSNYSLDKDTSNLGGSEGSSSSIADVATSNDSLVEDASDLGAPQVSSSTFSDVATSNDTLGEDASKTLVNGDASGGKSMVNGDVSATSDYTVR
jgi:hypothetical protein